MAENKGDRSYSGGGEDEAWEEEDGDAAISVSETERALRKAFEMYDLNGDGFITYLEVGDDPKNVNTADLFKPSLHVAVLKFERHELRHRERLSLRWTWI